jgi:hypothetical protein
MDINRKYRKALEELNLPLNPESWTKEQEAQWNEALDKIDFKYEEPELPEDYYIIKSTLHMMDGSVKTVVTDVRDLNIDQLKDLVSVMPEYSDYYYQKLAEGDSE